MNDEASKNPIVNQKDPNSIKELIKFTLYALIIILPIRYYIAKPFLVQGASMDPTYEDGQYLMVDQLSYRLHEPRRGDVIVFRYPNDKNKYYIKRIIGLPGETVSLDKGKVTVTNASHPKGFTLEETYLVNFSYDTTLPDTLASDEYFVMGDNRGASADSRAWGNLNRSFIVGRPALRLYPFTKLGIYPGQAQDELLTQ